MAVESTQQAQPQSPLTQTIVVQSNTAEVPKCCLINSFDNVRVMKGQMTIRCRYCETKTRAPIEVVKRWKCEAFFNTGECKQGNACPKLHLHFRKKSLKDRVKVHGYKVLDPILRAYGGHVNVTVGGNAGKPGQPLDALINKFGKLPLPNSKGQKKTARGGSTTPPRKESTASSQASKDTATSDCRESRDSRETSITSLASTADTASSEASYYRYDPYNADCHIVYL